MKSNKLKQAQLFMSVGTAWMWIKRNYSWILFWGVLLIIYLSNSLHTNFSDEFDNIVGGYYINKGILPYIGFFSHHNPGAYYIASTITFFTKQSFVHFRIIWSVVLFLTALISNLYLRRSLKGINISFYLVYLLLLGVASTYFWAHMLLAETVVAYALVPVYMLILFKSLHKLAFSETDVIFIFLATFITVWTSLTFIFAVAIIVCWFLFEYQKQKGFLSKNLLKAIAVLILPYILFLGHLLITRSLPEYYFQSIQYNRDYYIYNFPTVSGIVSKNPARYALSILYNTSIQFQVLALQVKNFNFDFPITITLLVGNISLLIYLLLTRRFQYAGLVYLVLVYLNARGEPLNSKETDFHSTVYIAFSLFNLIFMLKTMAEELGQKVSQVQSTVYKFLLLTTGVYTFFAVTFLMRLYAEKTYTKLMGQAPLIYDRPVAAPVINKLVTPNDYFWIGPFEFEELLYINAKLPSKYHWFLPAHERSNKIKKEFIADLELHRPKVIVFKEDLGYFGMVPKDFNYPIVNFLRKNYFRLEDLEREGKKYRVLVTGLHNFDIAVNFYFDKTRQEEILNNLITEKIIEPVL